MGWVPFPLGPMCLGLRGNPKGGAPLAWGASFPSLAAAPPLAGIWGAGPLSLSPIYSEGERGKQHPPPLLHLLLLRSAWRSPTGEPRAPSPPCRCAVRVLPQLLLCPCWINKEETSPGCTCVERGGAVVRRLDRNRPRSESLCVRLHQPCSCNASA